MISPPRKPAATAAIRGRRRAFAATLGQKGIGNASRVVVYDGGTAMYAGRLWWMLRWLGHDNVLCSMAATRSGRKKAAIDTTARQRAGYQLSGHRAKGHAAQRR